MNKQPIITSLLDTDLYKFTMLQTYLHQYPGADGEYRFRCRNRPAFPLAQLKDELEQELDHLCSLRFQPEELAYLRDMRFMRGDFIDFLELFRFRRRFIEVSVPADATDQLEIVARGPLVHVMLFEIFVLAVVSELYFRRFESAELIGEGRRRLMTKIQQLREFAREPVLRNPYVFFDFGTRRRAFRSWHEEVVTTLRRYVPDLFKGTSNVDLARRHRIVPIGTMAHEYLQSHQGLGYRLRDFQKMALENWVKKYRGDLGIALTDVVTMDAFLADFDLYFAKLFDGLRHDSGDPFVWGDKAIAHYHSLRVDPGTKMLTFSDGLDIPKTIELYRHFASRARVGFGIGTNLTNDVGVEPLNIVMKLVSCNGNPVAKISDAPGKTLCDNRTFIDYLQQVFNVTPAVAAAVN
jgi:nicotinate phosphoribosyltransferase